MKRVLFINNPRQLKASMCRIILTFTFCLLSFSQAAAQSVPELINYQGRLTDATGDPLASGEYTLSFSIYDAAIGGTAVWGPQVFDGATSIGHGAKVPVVDGYFNIILGAIDTSSRNITDAFVIAETYLEISVGSDPPISPRQKILSAPYAVSAKRVYGVYVDPANNNVGIGTTSPGANLEINDTSFDNELLGAGYGASDNYGDMFEVWRLNDGGDGSTFIRGRSKISIRSNLDRATPLQSDAAMTISGDKVGIGTTAPDSRLQVVGDVKFGSSGEYHANGGVEQLKTIRGTLNPDGSILSGTGFSCSHTGAGIYTITFSAVFSSAPTVVVSARNSSNPGDGAPWFRVVNVETISTSSFNVRTRVQQGGSTYNPQDIAVWDFIAVGPR